MRAASLVAVIVLASAGACASHAAPTVTADARRDSGAIDDTPSGGDGADSATAPDAGSAGCAFSPHVDVCAIAGSDASLGSGLEIAADTVFDTDAGTFSIAPVGNFAVHVDQPQFVGGQPVTVLVVASLTVDDGQRLVATGSLPLVIYSLADMSIGGPVDASSHNNDPTQYAGPSPCSGDPRAGGSGEPSSRAQSDGGGGGGGAGFGGAGGTGGRSNDSLGGSDGTAFAGVPDEVLGGCPGGNGGASFGGHVAVGGRGGGALELVTPGTIHLTLHGQVLAGGGGGDGGGDSDSDDGGAGGGGAGGYVGLGAGSGIVLDAGAVLAANGGGGGGGASDPGNPGGDGGPSATPAIGGAAANGNGNASGGTGGASATATTAQGGSPAASTAGGAGGGGGTGFILLHGPVAATGAIASPEPIDI